MSTMTDTGELTAAERADLDGETLEQETTLDRDLVGKIDPRLLQPVRTPAERAAALRAARDEVGLIYRGNKVSKRRSAAAIDLIVPDKENAAHVDDAIGDIKLFELEHWDAEANRPKVDLLRQTLHLSGPSYHFALNETTLVPAEDAPFFLTHEALIFERAADVHAHAEQEAIQSHPLWNATQAENADLKARLERLEAAIAQQQTQNQPED